SREVDSRDRDIEGDGLRAGRRLLSGVERIRASEDLVVVGYVVAVAVGLERHRSTSAARDQERLERVADGVAARARRVVGVGAAIRERRVRVEGTARAPDLEVVRRSVAV